jgi:putative transport protein
MSGAGVVERGDLLRLVGLEPAVERARNLVGAAVRPSGPTDFVTLGVAIFVDRGGCARAPSSAAFPTGPSRS